ncbi:MAG TPA: MarR family winged helix-turn-helix transcriptional regulator [Candidatus Dormibacteraeota bacterium]|nr:MarR family winged helix-turn-helix transcriptional regulator [Candidatus Dormibacteraeota bacterium]
MSVGGEALDVVERAMVAIRRSQSRRTLARLAQARHDPRRGGATGRGPGSPIVGSGFDVLDVVEAGEQAGSPIGVTGVGVALGIDQPRASKLVAAAVAAGLVRRKADQADGRRAFLVRTDAGRAASEEVRQFRRAVFAAAMSDWADADRADFARLLSRFVDGLGRAAR